MPALDSILQQKLSLLESKHLRREAKESARTSGNRVMRDGKQLISFSCNDYLGLSHHSDVLASAHQAIDRYGAGAAASRLVTGNLPLYTQLEAALATYKGTGAACVFGSGYLANLGTIPALVGAGDLIIADKLVHACMIDAARLSGATVMRFAHNNMDHCQLLLANNRADYQHCLILTETIFSMDGDRAPIGMLKRLSREHDAWLMVDDAHGTGILKTDPDGIDIFMGTMSKALGAYGGYVCGSQVLVDYIKTAARSLVFSTALPPSVLASSITALNIVQNDYSLGEAALNKAHYFSRLLGLPPAQSTIFPVIVGENERALAISQTLEANGYLVTAIRPPTVPENTARLRFAFNTQHTNPQIEAVVAILKQEGLPCAP